MSLTLAALLLVFPVCVFVPGFLAVRRFDLPDELRLSVSVTVSLAFLYGATFVLWVLDAGVPAFFGILIAISVAAVAYLPEIRAYLRSPRVRAILLHHAIFATWLLALSLLVRNISGGGWSGDWAEHYQRAVFFCGGAPVDVLFIGQWPLTARPPLNNIVAAFFLKIAGTDFAAYQLVTVLLGSLQFLGAASLCFAITRGRNPRTYAGLLVLATLLSLNPSVVHNATHTWTRPLANLFALQAAALILLALREGSRALRRWGYLHLGLALVTHYSIAPYLIALALVESWWLAKRRLSLREAGLCVLVAAAPMAPWLAFALHRFGFAGTFLSNNTAKLADLFGPAEFLFQALGNLGATLVPHVLRGVPPLFPQEYAAAHLRDSAFLTYQQSLLVMMGSLGGLAIVWLLTTGAIRRVQEGRRETPALVTVFVAAVVAFGIASVGGVNPYGMAHVCLQPLAVGGLVFLSTRWSDSPAWLRAGLGIGLVLDATLGIGLHFWMQHLTLDDVLALSPGAPVVSPPFLGNLVAKLQNGYVFLGELQGWDLMLAATTAALVALVTQAIRAAAGEARGAEAG